MESFDVLRRGVYVRRWTAARDTERSAII